jgi:magnesium transporter
VSIEALLSSSDGSERGVDLREWSIGRVRDDELLWVDITGHEAEDVQIVREALELDDGAATALAREIGAEPGATVHTEAVELTLLWLDDGAQPEPVPLQVLAGSGWVVTRHVEPLERLERQREKITDQREIGMLRPVEFVVAILGWHVDGFHHTAAHLERAVDRLDEEALRTDRDLLDHLVAMRQRIARARRIAAAHADVYAEIARPDFLPGLEEKDDVLLAKVTDRLERATAAIAGVRDMLIGTFDVHMTRTAQRTNDIVRVLTWTSVILLPAVVVAGIMGMNFDVWLFERAELFWVVIGFMVSTAVVTLLVARLKGWL